MDGVRVTVAKLWAPHLPVKGGAISPPKGASPSPSGVLAANLRAARVAAGLTQATAAKMAGLNPQTVSDHERAVYEPEEETLTDYARVYRTTPAVLRYGGNGGDRLMVRESPIDRVPSSSLGLPKSVRVWLHGFLLELAEADVPDEQIESAKAVLTSPENFAFFVGSHPAAGYTEEEILDGLKAFALHIRGVLRERGFKVRAK